MNLSDIVNDQPRWIGYRSALRTVSGFPRGIAQRLYCTFKQIKFRRKELLTLTFLIDIYGGSILTHHFVVDSSDQVRRLVAKVLT